MIYTTHESKQIHVDKLWPLPLSQLIVVLVFMSRIHVCTYCILIFTQYVYVFQHGDN